MYASFRWARGKNYVLKTTALIMILSFLSTVGIYVVWYFTPLPFLSFPFYDYWDERRLILPPPMKYSAERIDCWGICFITAIVFQLAPQGPATQSGLPEMGWVHVASYRVVLLDMEIGAVHPMLVLFTLFLFFTAVNALGALLGFSISKIPITQKTSLGSMAFLGRIALGIIILVYGIWLFAGGEVVLTSPSSRYYNDYDPSYLVFGAWACVVFGISWLVTMIAEKLLQSNWKARVQLSNR